MPKVPSFLCNQPVFEPETTIAMVEAFLDVCRELNLGSDNQARKPLRSKSSGSLNAANTTGSS